MKIIAIGDIHGRNDWKEIVKRPSDKVVFIGDYLDTHESISPAKQEANLEEIIQFKKAHPERVVLLIGNHDYHYISSVARTGMHYSGFQGHMLASFSGIIDTAIKDGDIQAIYKHEDILFSHAGITENWCYLNHIDKENIVEHCNNRLLHDTSIFGFITNVDGVYMYGSPYGDNTWQSPLWVRPKSLKEDKIKGFRQVVGHTTQNKLNISNDIAFIDVLGETGEYLEIIDGVFNPSKVPVK